MKLFSVREKCKTSDACVFNRICRKLSYFYDCIALFNSQYKHVHIR